MKKREEGMTYTKEQLEYLIQEEIRSRYNDIISVSGLFVQMAGNDLIGGILLSQIHYWYRASKKTGESKVSILKLDRETGEYHTWIAKTIEEWADQCFMSPYQVRSRLRKLENAGIIRTQVNRFNKLTYTHTRIVWEAFFDKKHEILNVRPAGNKENYVPESRNDKNLHSGNDKNLHSNGMIKTYIPLTENTNEYRTSTAQPENGNRKKSQPSTLKELNAVVSMDILKQLQEWGITPEKIHEWVDRYTTGNPEELRPYIKFTQREKRTNPAGFFLKAVREGWRIPPEKETGKRLPDIDEVLKDQEARR